MLKILCSLHPIKTKTPWNFNQRESVREILATKDKTYWRREEETNAAIGGEYQVNSKVGNRNKIGENARNRR